MWTGARTRGRVLPPGPSFVSVCGCLLTSHKRCDRREEGGGDAAYTDAWTQANEVAQDFCELHFVSFLRHVHSSRCWLVYAELRWWVLSALKLSQ